MAKIIQLHHRKGTVQPKFRLNANTCNYFAVPAIRIEGRWLEAVTEPGERYTVTVQPEARALTITFGDNPDPDGSFTPAFVDHLDALYYDGYAADLQRAHPDAYRYEFTQFLNQYKTA